MRDCLTCRYMDEPTEPHMWHRCLWPDKTPTPMSLLDWSWRSVDVDVPFVDCPAWIKREANHEPQK